MSAPGNSPPASPAGITRKDSFMSDSVGSHGHPPPQSLPPAMPQTVLAEVAAEPGSSGPRVEISVPFAILFFSADGVIVEYCVRVKTSRGLSQIAKRFSEVASLDEHLNGNRWFNIVSPSRLPVPKLTTATVGKTNSSCRAVAKRRDELDRYFKALTAVLAKEHGPKRDAAVRHIMMFLQCESSGPAALLPEAFRSAASGDHLVYAFWRVPESASVAHSAPNTSSSGGRSSPETRHRTPDKRAVSPSNLPPPPPTDAGPGSRRSSGLAPSRGGSHIGAAAVDGGAASTSIDASWSPSHEYTGPQVMKRITVALPRSLLFLDGQDNLTAALCSEKSERRPEAVSRYRELLAFYNFVASNGDRIPSPDEARTFFLDRQSTTAAKVAPKRESHSPIRNVDAQVTPSPDAASKGKHGRGSRGSNKSDRGSDSDPASPPREALLVGRNPISGGLTAQVPRGHGNAFALRVSVVPAARETSNSMHLVANEPGSDGSFAPCLHCLCNDQQLCGSGHERVRDSPRTSRFIMASEHWLDITPPHSGPPSRTSSPPPS